VFSIVLVIIYTSFSAVLNSVERARKEQTELRTANFLVTHFQENISGAYLSFGDTVLPGKTAQQGGLEVQSGSFVGEDQETDGHPADTLTFCTTATRMGPGALPGDTKQVTYSLMEGANDNSVFTVYESPRLALPMTTAGDESGSATASWSLPMARLDFKYFDGTDWLESWDSGKTGALPCGVKIEAHFLEKELSLLADQAGAKEPVLIMVVKIPLGLRNQRIGG
jgi:hypothetical protein